MYQGDASKEEDDARTPPPPSPKTWVFTWDR
jgi:hypothetical protein